MDFATIMGISIVCGVCMYLFLILNLRVTKDPNEQLNDSLSNKISVATSIITFIVLFSAEQVLEISSNSGVDSTQLLSKWE